MNLAAPVRTRSSRSRTGSGRAASRSVAGRLWSTAMTLGALSVVGLPAFVVFSRRWYWLYRADGEPELRGVGDREAVRRPGTWRGSPPSGPRSPTPSRPVDRRHRHARRRFPTRGRALARRPLPGRPASVPLRCSHAVQRCAHRRAAQEADQATAGRRVGGPSRRRGRAARQRIDVVTIERRLAALGPATARHRRRRHPGVARGAAGHPASDGRPDDPTERQLERTVAQICELPPRRKS